LNKLLLNTLNIYIIWYI